MHSEDERLTQLARLLRREAGVSQREAARRAGVPRDDAIAIEAGDAGDVRIDPVRS